MDLFRATRKADIQNIMGKQCVLHASGGDRSVNNLAVGYCDNCTICGGDASAPKTNRFYDTLRVGNLDGVANFEGFLEYDYN